MIVLSHPEWWLDQERVQENEQRQPVEPEHTWVNLETLRRAREPQPPPSHDPGRDRDIGR